MAVAQFEAVLEIAIMITVDMSAFYIACALNVPVTINTCVVRFSIG
jgi:hypothetical protein